MVVCKNHVEKTGLGRAGACFIIFFWDHFSPKMTLKNGTYLLDKSKTFDIKEGEKRKEYLIGFQESL